eukprot:m.70674 g.70674  ORF g.70674 m.70674 type:complete len:61 (-) comp18537_c0_seq1:106-288(-)
MSRAVSCTSALMHATVEPAERPTRLDLEHHPCCAVDVDPSMQLAIAVAGVGGKVTDHDVG